MYDEVLSNKKSLVLSVNHMNTITLDVILITASAVSAPARYKLRSIQIHVQSTDLVDILMLIILMLKHAILQLSSVL